MIFTKGSGKLTPAKIEWETEKDEIIEYVQKVTILRNFSALKKLIKDSTSIEELHKAANDNTKYDMTNQKLKVNDSVHRVTTYKYKNTKYLLNPKKLTTLWGFRAHNHQSYNKEEFNVKHLTVKLLQLMERLIEMTTKQGDSILDPFLGSGTTYIAANSLHRNAIGFELDKEYYIIAQNRVQQSVENR